MIDIVFAERSHRACATNVLNTRGARSATILIPDVFFGRNVNSDVPQRLTPLAKECGPLCLHDPLDGGAPTRFAILSRPVVDAVLVLVSAALGQRIAIRAVRQRGTFVTNRRIQNRPHCLMNAAPFIPSNSIASLERMNCRLMQDLRRIEIADTGQCALIEQRHFDGAARGAKLRAKLFGRDRERVGTEHTCAISAVKLMQSN